MKIAILGTRGIPNNYGGFEQCAENLSVGLVENGYDVTVYSIDSHPYQSKIFKGVNSLELMHPRIRKVNAIIIAHNLYVLISSKGQNPIIKKTIKKTIPKLLFELLFISIIYLIL